MTEAYGKMIHRLSLTFWCTSCPDWILVSLRPRPRLKSRLTNPCNRLRTSLKPPYPRP